jgi:hypothetical protein
VIIVMPPLVSPTPAPPPPVPTTQAPRTSTGLRVVGVRVLAAEWQGRMPANWDFSDAPHIVANLNVVGPELGLSFTLESTAEMPVDRQYSMIASTFQGAKSAIAHYVSTGKVSNQVIDVVVVEPDPTTWVGGWGNNDQPLSTNGSWPVITSTTRALKAEAHWVAHELGHVLGYFDTTYYGDSPQQNIRYTRCGLAIDSTTYPQDAAPQGYKENFMSYNTALRRSFFTDGLADDYRKIKDCWIASSKL